MPIPAPPTVVGTANARTCGAPNVVLTLGAIIAAMGEATDEEKGQFCTKLNEWGCVPNFDGTWFFNEFSLLSPEQISTLSGELGGGGGGSTDFVTAYNLMSDAEQHAFNCWFINTILHGGTYEGNVTVDPTAEHSGLSIDPSSCGFNYNLVLGKDVGDSLMPVEVRIVEFDTCDRGVIEVKTPVLVKTFEGVTYDQADMFGRIECMLGSLLKCCPPCAETELTSLDIEGHGELDWTDLLEGTGAPGSLKRVSRLVFEQVSDPNQAWGYLASPDIQLLGKMRLKAETNALREVFFVNSSPQEFKIERDDIKGLSYWIYPGQVLQLRVFARNEWFHVTPP